MEAYTPTIWSEAVVQWFYGKSIFKLLQEEKPMDHILKNVCLINLNISLWAGRKSMKPSDLAAGGIDISKLPPGSLVSLGSKKTIDPKAIKQFISLKREAIQACLRYGIRFGTCGYAVPEDKMADIATKLSVIKSQFANDKAKFLTSYQSDIEDWINKNPVEWQSIIRNCVDGVTDVDYAMGFNFSVFRVNAPDNIDNGLDDEVGGLHAQLCKEIRTDAKIAFDTSYAGKKEVGQRALRPIKAIRDKITALSFLDPDLPALADMIDSNLNIIGKASIIKGDNLNMISGLLANHLMNLGKATVYEEAADLLEEPEDICGIDAPVAIVPVKEIASLTWDF